MNCYRSILLLSLALAVPALPAANASDCGGSVPCVPRGKTKRVTFQRPPLGQPGDPVSAQWTGGGTGKPQAFDLDLLSDDHMGAATPGDPPTTATVAIENSGGHLSGPNGDTVAGGADGDCVELYLRWSYHYEVTITNTTSKSVRAEPGGVGETTTTSTSTSHTIYMRGYKESCVAEVCPC